MCTVTAKMAVIAREVFAVIAIFLSFCLTQHNVLSDFDTNNKVEVSNDTSRHGSPSKSGSQFSSSITTKLKAVIANLSASEIVSDVFENYNRRIPPNYPEPVEVKIGMYIKGKHEYATSMRVLGGGAI